MPVPVFLHQFERDIKRMEKRGKDFDKLKVILGALIEDRELDSIHRDHKMFGNWLERRECHVEPDWLLIYKKEDNRITFERTGSHADLFE